ncbi:DUF4331 family protein [Ahniella affigens]|nr:DUF4331 family protein [Ahniella affigens]
MNQIQSLVLACVLAGCSNTLSASDHLDSPTVTADPAADIADLYGWMSPDRGELNLVMDISGKRFSDTILYSLHVGSSRDLHGSQAEVTIDCRFDQQARVRCAMGNDVAAGDASGNKGLWSQHRQFHVFAGLRDDPFFNNVRGTRQAYDVAAMALASATMDDAGCPQFGADTASEIKALWRQTDGGPAQNFLSGWSVSALILSVSVKSINQGGPLLSIWASTHATTANGEADTLVQVDRVGRTLTGNALLGLLNAEIDVDQLKEQYNRAAPKEWPGFTAEIARGLARYDAFDGHCGNQWLADASTGADRYARLAALLADDRLWIDSRFGRCEHAFAVELGHSQKFHDCGGRTPSIDTIDAFRSLLIHGNTSDFSDGVSQDAPMPSSTRFPFLAKP